jgi:hypothetical protein
MIIGLTAGGIVMALAAVVPNWAARQARKKKPRSV